MDQQPINDIVKRSLFHKLPKWLRVIVLILSILTVIYWLCWLIYKWLYYSRVIGAFIFDKRNYWTFLCCILILGVGSLILAQFVFNLDPFGALAQSIKDMWQSFREWLGGLISGV